MRAESGGKGTSGIAQTRGRGRSGGGRRPRGRRGGLPRGGCAAGPRLLEDDGVAAAEPLVDGEPAPAAAEAGVVAAGAGEEHALPLLAPALQSDHKLVLLGYDWEDVGEARGGLRWRSEETIHVEAGVAETPQVDLGSWVRRPGFSGLGTERGRRGRRSAWAPPRACSQ